MERLLCLVLKLYPWVNLNNGIRNVPGMKGTRVFVENCIYKTTKTQKQLK